MDIDIYKEYNHNPPHLFLPNTKYFITGSTYKHIRYLRDVESKHALLSSIKKGFEDEGWILEDWVILDNHYHIMVNAPANPLSLGKIIKEIHRFNALWIKKHLDIPQRTIIWYNYWDSCITYEESYFARLNYIWFNPVKHSYVEDPEDWIHGSYFLRIRNENEYLDMLKKRYPFDKLKIGDDF